MGNKNLTRSVPWRGIVWRALAGTPYQQAMTTDYRTYGYNRVGSHNPAYRRLIKQGLNASGTLTVTVSNAESEGFRTKVWRRKTADEKNPDYGVLGTFGHDGVFLNVNEPLGLTGHQGSSSSDEARRRAISVFNQTTTRRRRQLQGVVVAGELGKTLKMVVGPGRAFRTAADRSIRRATKIAKRRTSMPKPDAKFFSDIWLEMVFGWKPLIADIHDGAVAVARVATKDALEREQFRCHGQHEALVSTFNGLHGPLGYDASSSALYRSTITTVDRSEFILYGRYTARLQGKDQLYSDARRLAELSGLNWEDVAPQVWELIPYSFLIDYFANVGDVIEGCANLYTSYDWVEEVLIRTTEEIRAFNIDSADLKTRYGGTYVTHDAPTTFMRQSYRTVTRREAQYQLRPELSFRLPVDMQWLNIAALAAGGHSFQTFSKR